MGATTGNDQPKEPVKRAERCLWAEIATKLKRRQINADVTLECLHELDGVVPINPKILSQA